MPDVTVQPANVLPERSPARMVTVVPGAYVPVPLPLGVFGIELPLTITP